MQDTALFCDLLEKRILNINNEISLIKDIRFLLKDPFYLKNRFESLAADSLEYKRALIRVKEGKF